MIKSEYICDICKETVSNPDVLVRITYRVDKSDEPYTISPTIAMDLCEKCYREYSKLFDRKDNR